MKVCVSLMLAGAAIALTGCASTSTSYVRSERYAPVKTENDMVYVQAVESAAWRRGVGVVWVHPPRRVATDQPN